ncbi:predicted protein [Naegleria gruberi]|uniref:Predicted protein n=1 Tax=Naegleria gruberi TaxID=5762 RepID=D2UYB5_NAEGR|nr:uncharacterized protein NAEGRDRAFT_61414 [Naegleria gruberi]EFC50446.1 predicted protein [Naegleria gruberi]|eukprot:XP_002683190.1 predicted protein [Naegleria gruberi strain NEG-M]
MEKEQRASQNDAPKNILRIFNNTTIVERDISKSSITLPTIPSQPQPFPTLKQPTLTFLGRRKKQEEKTKPLEKSKQTLAPTIEKPVLEKIEKLKHVQNERVSEEDSIDKESDKMLSEMSNEEIQEAQEQILKNFDSSLINLLKNRGLKKKQAKEKSTFNPKDITPKEPVKMSQEEKKEIIEKDITEIIEKIKDSLNPSELKNVKDEEEKLKWIVGGQEIIAESEEEKKDNSRFKPLRFDLEGNVIDKNKEYHVQSGLYHHGGDQSEAGYTILEIFQLIRSSVINQRIINIKLLSSIIKKIGSNNSFELIEYLESKYELFKTIFWFGYADATNGSPTVLHKNLNLITVTSELVRTLLSTLYSKQDEINQMITRDSFDFGLHTLNNSISEKVDIIKKYEKDITQHVISDMVSILECEDDNTLLECVLDCLALFSRYSLTVASKIVQEMLKKFAFKGFNSSLFYKSPRLATNYAKMCSALACHGKNICERIIKNTNIIDISKQYLTLCLSEQNEELLEFCNELVSFIVACTSYKIVSVMHLFCQEMFPNLVTIIQLAFKKNHQAIRLSKHCLFLMQVYMESKSALSFPSFEDKDEVDENSIGHLENFILEDCPLLAVKALKSGMESLCIRFLYFICTFYDNFYCNPNSDFARFISKDDIDTTSQILMVMKRVENRVFYQEIYQWAELILNQLESLENSADNFETITKLLANITSVVTICYFSSKSFKHLFGVLYNDIHFESLLLRIYNSVFTKYLFTKEFYSKSLFSENPLRYKYFILRERFFNLSFYFLKLYTYEKTRLKDLISSDQICNLALFTSSLLEPIKFKGDRYLFFYILQTFVLNYHPTLLNYLDKDLFEVSQSESEKDNIIESNNIQVGAPFHSQEFEPTSPNWMKQRMLV